MAGAEIGAAPGGEEPPPDGYREQYGIIVTCRDESHQAEVYEDLLAQGFECKVVAT